MTVTGLSSCGVRGMTHILKRTQRVQLQGIVLTEQGYTQTGIFKTLLFKVLTWDLPRTNVLANHAAILVRYDNFVLEFAGLLTNIIPLQGLKISQSQGIPHKIASHTGICEKLRGTRVLTPVAGSIFRPLSHTYISDREFKNGHIPRFCSVFQVIKVISSGKFFSAKGVDLSFNSETKEHPQISNPSFW